MASPDLTSSCPRCGYDQSGVVATWEKLASCPMAGTCSECGLEFVWGDVLNPRFVREMRLYEIEERRVALAYVNTWFLACRPWRLWRRVTMVQPVRSQRLWWMAFGGAAMGHLVGCFVLALVMVASAAVLIGWPNYFWGRHPYMNDVASAAAPVLNALDRGESYQAIGIQLASVVAICVMVALMPLTWRLVPTTLERCGVLPRHLLRIWAYTAATVPVVMVLSLSILLVVWTGAAFVFPDAGGFGWPDPVWSIDRPLQRAIETRWVWVAPLVWVWLVACQGWAFSRYLKLPRAWVVAAVLSVPPGMVALILGIAIWVSSVWH